MAFLLRNRDAISYLLLAENICQRERIRMNILNITKNEGSVTAELSADDLVMICNALYAQYEENGCKEKFLELYSDMMLAKDLCQYGHIDSFTLRKIVKCRNQIGKGLNGVLPDNDVKILNSYLEGEDINTAFENSDWCEVYRKIAGDKNMSKFRKKLEE